MLSKIVVNTSILFLAASLTGCGWVKVKPYAEHVRVIGADQVAYCRNLTTLNVKVQDKILFIPRASGSVRTDMENYARNEAHLIGGDSIVPVSEICDGRQTFYVYRCGGN